MAVRRRPRQPEPASDLPADIAAKLDAQIARAPHLAEFFRKYAEHDAGRHDPPRADCGACSLEHVFANARWWGPDGPYPY
jgi:hypothetical protein